MNNTLHQYKSSAELKALAREHLLGRYDVVVGATAAAVLIVLSAWFLFPALIDKSTLSGTVLIFMIRFGISIPAGLFTSGILYMHLKLSCNRPITISDVFCGFKLLSGKALLIQLYLSVWTYIIGFLPTTILSYFVLKNPQNAMLSLIYSMTIVWGGVVVVMVVLIYMQAFCLLHDFPEYSANDLLLLSRRLMKNNKFRLFYIFVSFIPLMLLGLLSCGIAFLWILPYMCAVETEFFLDLVRNTAL